MNQFDQTLLAWGLPLFLWVFGSTLWALLRIGRRFQPGIFITVAVALLGVPVAILAGSLGVLLLALWSNPSGVLTTISRMPVETAAYFLETGGEFSISGLLSILFFCAAQIAKARPSDLKRA